MIIDDPDIELIARRRHNAHLKRLERQMAKHWHPMDPDNPGITQKEYRQMCNEADPDI